MKPILFNTEMVHAILEGRKTVTRRVVKPQPPATALVRNRNRNTWDWAFWEDNDEGHLMKPPYHPGDILYVRETWAKMECMECSEDADDCESAVERDGLTIFCNGDMYVYRATDLLPSGYKWRPSIHMPREATRLFLRVTDVRVERLQDITPEQAMAEGVIDPSPSRRPYIRYEEVGQIELYAKNKVFPDIWNSTIKPADHALYGWDANPWVWVIEFERCEKPKEDT